MSDYLRLLAVFALTLGYVALCVWLVWKRPMRRLHNAMARRFGMPEPWPEARSEARRAGEG